MNGPRCFTLNTLFYTHVIPLLTTIWYIEYTKLVVYYEKQNVNERYLYCVSIIIDQANECVRRKKNNCYLLSTDISILVTVCKYIDKKLNLFKRKKS